MRFAMACIGLPVLVVLSACGGGSSDSYSNSGGTSSGSGDNTSGSSSGSGTSSTAKYYRRTDNETALALDGGNSYFCSWGDCPSGVTCGMTIYGAENGSQVDWQIPTTADGGNKVKTTFDIVRSGSGLTLYYQGSRTGDYVQVSSWSAATSGDGGYCSGNTSSSGSNGSGSGSGSGSSSGGTSSGGSTTGQIAVYTRRSSSPAAISVTIDGQSVGSLTSYFFSTPNCGDSGTITRTLPVGTHTLSASSGNLSWGPGSFSITAGGCLTYELQ